MDPVFIRHKHYFVRPISNRNELNTKRLPIERERLQPQWLRKRSDVTLPVENSSIMLHLSLLRQFANNRIRLIRDSHSRSPDLIEPLVRQSCSRVREPSILPAQRDSDVGGE